MCALSVIIVSYNTCSLTLSCLENLKALLATTDHEIIVVDNNSSDGSAEAIDGRFPYVRLLRNVRNVGFGVANNQAFELAKGKYFLLLNTDAFPLANSIGILMRRLESNPRIAAVGPRLQYADGTLQESVHRFASPILSLQHHLGWSRLRGRVPNQTRPSAEEMNESFIKGACLLVRASVYSEIGGFDPDFFFYGDEADWQKRMIRRGFTVGFETDATAVHHEGSSGKKNRLRFTLHYYASNDIFIFKHHGFFGLFIHRLSILIWCIRKLIVCFFTHPVSDGREFRFLLAHLFTPTCQMSEAVERLSARGE